MPFWLPLVPFAKLPLLLVVLLLLLLSELSFLSPSSSSWVEEALKGKSAGVACLVFQWMYVPFAPIKCASK